LRDLIRARASRRPDRFADSRTELLRDLGDEVEGKLPPDTVELVRSDLLRKLEAIENTRIDCTPVIVD
jgi:hypothetical protein